LPVSRKYSRNGIFRKISVLCIFIPVISLAQEPLDQITLQLKWKHAFQFAGYYADAGLEVHLQELSDERSPPEVLLQGDAEYAVTGPICSSIAPTKRQCRI
jgi:hypothetical protein